MKKNVLQLHRGRIKHVKEDNTEKKAKEVREEKQFYRVTYEALGFGMSVALPIVLGALFGSYLDSKYGTGPRYVLLMLLLGIITGGYSFFKTLTKLNK